MLNTRKVFKGSHREQSNLATPTSHPQTKHMITSVCVLCSFYSISARSFTSGVIAWHQCYHVRVSNLYTQTSPAPLREGLLCVNPPKDVPQWWWGSSPGPGVVITSKTCHGGFSPSRLIGQKLKTTLFVSWHRFALTTQLTKGPCKVNWWLVHGVTLQLSPRDLELRDKQVGTKNKWMS